MRAYSIDALVLRTYRYGEADRIVVFLTEDRGKKRGVAKNATASRRRFGAGLEPLTRGRVAYVERESRDLVRLDRIEPRASPMSAPVGRPGPTGESAAPDGNAAHRLGHASYFAELLDEWAPEGMPNARLFRLGSATGDALAGARSVEALARYFEFWLMRLEGVYPGLDVCPRCRRQSLTAGAVFAAGDRAYVCDGCANGGPHLSSEAVRFLREAVRRTPVEVDDATMSRGALRELEEAHGRLIAVHLEKELRSTKVIKELGSEM